MSDQDPKPVLPPEGATPASCAVCGCVSWVVWCQPSGRVWGISCANCHIGQRMRHRSTGGYFEATPAPPAPTHPQPPGEQ